MEFTDEPFAGLNGPVNLDFQPPFISDFQMISSILSLDLSQSILLADFNLTRFILQLLLFVLSLWLIFLVLIQRGKGGGLTGALGGSGGSSAFGAKAGDAFTRVTVVSATLWIFPVMNQPTLKHPAMAVDQLQPWEPAILTKAIRILPTILFQPTERPTMKQMPRLLTTSKQTIDSTRYFRADQSLTGTFFYFPLA